DALRAAIPKEQDSAFVQLAWFPVKAAANYNRLQIATGRNRLWAGQGRIAANAQADLVKTLFARDAELTRLHDALNGGKWRHMMDQTHIGYTSWQQPAQNIKPATHTLAAAAGWGVAVEGGGEAPPALARWGANRRWIDVFSKGAPIAVTAVSDAPWLTVATGPAIASGDVLLEVSADWRQA
ncbi:MAG: hypothetical protein ACK44A_17705, partial [Roseateles sp.]